MKEPKGNDVEIIVINDVETTQIYIRKEAVEQYVAEEKANGNDVIVVRN